MIDERETELLHLDPEYHVKMKTREEMQSELSSTNDRIEWLYGKQGRGRQFSSISERNNFLQSQIEQLKRQVIGL